ncbi:hypothetical protein [Acidimangrovimonas sediminis]|uniref:hypothetical protein n=1 Tax=Acidimangrovimonas sediminis TaxID=2056283 RepID=UPI001E65D7ED|nr:hypothetical protein [Acidimangrovimonas sediminis]
MALISDILLAAGAFAAAFYCWILSRRLTRFTKLESGMGGAIAVLSAQVDDLTRALEKAQRTAVASTEDLSGLTARGEEVAGRIELLLASLHDLPEAPASSPPARSAPTSRPAQPDGRTEIRSETPETGSRRLHFSRQRSRRAEHASFGEAAE